MHEVLLTARQNVKNLREKLLELYWLNVHDGHLQLIVSDIFKFYKNQCTDYFNEVFCSVDDNGVAMRSCSKNWNYLFVSQN